MKLDSGATHTVITDYLAELKAALDALPQEQVQALVQALYDAYAQERQVIIAGNGGSAATASHMVCDLAKTVLGQQFDTPIKRFRVFALNDNVPLLTALGNDIGYEATFAQPLRNLANHEDLLIVMTGSGNSANILEVVRVAHTMGLKTFGLLGFDGGKVKDMLDRYVLINSTNYGVIEDLHMILVHIITAYFKQALSQAHPAPVLAGL